MPVINSLDLFDGPLTLKIKKLDPNAVIPSYAKPGDAGLDLTATSMQFEQLEHGSKQIVYGTGLAVEIPAGHVGLIFPRSSIAKTALALTNAVGVIDSGYRGEIKFKFRIDSGSRPNREAAYKVGDRIGQLVIMPYPQIDIKEVSELASSDRGDGGFGSTGK